MASSGARLLTGATDGIGLALARCWHARGQDAYLHGRRALADLPPGPFSEERYVQADLAHPEGPERVARALRSRGVEELELLLLNHATGWVGAPGDQPAESVRELVAVNLRSSVELCRLLLPALLCARGRVVLVSSVAAALPAPRFAVYAATKAALEGFARSLRVELGGRVQVQVVRPGAVRTALHAKSGLPDLDASRFATPESAAAALDRAVAGSSRWRTLGAANALAAALGRLAPGLVDAAAERRARR